jgi:hypothetical protein
MIPLLAFLLCACSSSAPPSMLLTDVIQIRPVLADDGLAMKARDPEGEIVGVGDVVIADLHIDRVYMKRVSDERYDLVITMSEAGGRSRWKKYWQRHNNARLALLIDGVVLRQFTMEEPPETDAITVVVQKLTTTKEESERLQARLDAKATRVKTPGQ